MTIDILAAQPGLLSSPFSHSILQRAQKRDLVRINLIDLREYGIGPHRQIDDYQYGGGAGMVIMMEPLVAALEDLERQEKYDEIIFLTPDGQKLTQKTANRLSLKKKLLLVCGHYKGIDERFRERYVSMEVSIGDYVLSGGELAAAVLTDAVVRLIPGVLNDETSALTDSFQDNLLSPPTYTRPAEFRGMKVPDILLSGHDAKINEWRHEQSLKRTRERRPDLLDE